MLEWLWLKIVGLLVFIGWINGTVFGMNRKVRILGTHGVPAAYGGFETAAENVALFLVAQGWDVTVYCQEQGDGPATEDVWQGIKRVKIPVLADGWIGTSTFDLISVRHACRSKDLCLTFGYNTGIFNILQRFKGIPNVINMDGIEWSRKRWGVFKQAILYVNERFAALFGNHLIADHPEIETYLRTRASARKITTITYGADPVSPSISESSVVNLGLAPHLYISLIARAIPENSILEIVQGFSKIKRDCQLVILGKYDFSADEYHRQVRDAASNEVVFLGAIYDKAVVQALRFHSIAYAHGHTVGGTNPSLVEAMAAGNAVIAHDNLYNRWVAQEGGVYFQSADSFSDRLDELLNDPTRLQKMGAASLQRYAEEFTWARVAGQYEQLLLRYHP